MLEVQLTPRSQAYASFTALQQPNRHIMGNTMTGPAWKSRQCSAEAWRGSGLLLAAALCASLGLAGPSGAISAEWVVVDPNSGLAINGFDPVAYFTDGAALPGKGEFEQAFAGTVWRFRSAGNRAAFLADPEVYMPRFGGYDPVGLTRGIVVAGNPKLWLISAQRLYLFYATDAQQEFANDSARVIATADSEWPRIQKTITP
jgi:hypothetical protein